MKMPGQETAAERASMILKYFYYVDIRASHACNFYRDNRDDPTKKGEIESLAEYFRGSIALPYFANGAELLNDPLLKAAYRDARSKLAEFAELSGRNDILKKLPDLPPLGIDDTVRTALTSSMCYIELIDQMRSKMRQRESGEPECGMDPGTLADFANMIDSHERRNGIKNEVLDEIKKEARDIFEQYTALFPVAKA